MTPTRIPKPSTFLGVVRPGYARAFAFLTQSGPRVSLAFAVAERVTIETIPAVRKNTPAIITPVTTY